MSLDFVGTLSSLLLEAWDEQTCAARVDVKTRDSLPTDRGRKTNLPAQVGGIAGSYAFCLVVVAVTLLLLSKRRREHLRSGEEFDLLQQPTASAVLPFPETFRLQDSVVPFALKSPTSDSFVSHSVFQSSSTVIVGHSTPVGAPAYGYGSVYDTGSPISPTETTGGTVALALVQSQETLYLSASYASPFRAPGVDPSVDQTVVSADRAMAQSQLETMYKYVMEQEEARANNVVLTGLPAPLSSSSGTGRRSEPNCRQMQQSVGTMGESNMSSSTNSLALTAAQDKDERAALSAAARFRKEKTKPIGLTMNLGEESREVEEQEEEMTSLTSRTASLLSALKSPRFRKKTQGMSISSPILTPTSSTFPRFGPVGGRAGLGHGNDRDSGDGEAEQMSAIPPRHYTPTAAPPLPPTAHSIDQRIGTFVAADSLPPRRAWAIPARIKTTSDSSGADVDSDAPAVASTGRFPSLMSLPASPRATKAMHFQQPPPSPSPQQDWPLSPTGVAFVSASPSTSFAFSRSAHANAPPAIRTGGSLPLRAYEPSLASPSFAAHNQTKQTILERAAPLASGGPTTPWTGAPVPYSPYQPFSPVVPMTPSLVTKADRKRMRRLEPKTPTMVMVPSNNDLW
ncbi:hypothetical protein SEPCBS119000_000031 [Sporothrix epigloea]|uniref:Transmembrane protein n=1 Tax=Sporothrix epigloea TaxID=1892477 RepID=A0ABP0D307_9PEZI